jgi:hypothetical protein
MSRSTAKPEDEMKYNEQSTMNETAEVFKQGHYDQAYRMFLDDPTHNAEVDWTFEKFCEAFAKLVKRMEMLKEQESVLFEYHD